MNILKIIISFFVIILLTVGVVYGIKTNNIEKKPKAELIYVEEDQAQDFKPEIKIQQNEKSQFIKKNLTQSTWVWEQTVLGEITSVYSKKIIPKKIGEFTLTFMEDGTVSGQTDCNNFGGTYIIEDNRITFGNFMSTMMYCENSQEQEFISMIKNGTVKIETNSLRLITDNSDVFFVAK
jgi:heat shock protein HslJ